MRPFVLFCAGEDSGDILGEAFVRKAVEKNFDALGAGGIRMQKAGLKPAVLFDDLPVNGFGDVLLHARKLSKHLKTLEDLLKRENCAGLFAVDYPGFNLKLMQLALKLEKKVVYLEPPQIWAWRQRRVKLFLSEKAKRLVELRTCYDIQVNAYEKFGLKILREEHPFETAQRQFSLSEKPQTGPVLLFPGSRLSQMRRNLPLYAAVADKLKTNNFPVKFIASRKAVAFHLENLLKKKFPVEISPQSSFERFALFHSAACVVTGPGSAAVEAFLAGTPCVAASRIEPLTYFLGKAFLRTPFLCLPNIEASFAKKEPPIPEIVQTSLSNLESHTQRILTEIQNFISFKTCS